MDYTHKSPMEINFRSNRSPLAGGGGKEGNNNLSLDSQYPALINFPPD